MPQHQNRITYVTFIAFERKIEIEMDRDFKYIIIQDIEMVLGNLRNIDLHHKFNTATHITLVYLRKIYIFQLKS